MLFSVAVLSLGIDQLNSTGVITALFNNGKAKVRMTGNSSPTTYEVSKLTN